MRQETAADQTTEQPQPTRQETAAKQQVGALAGDPDDGGDDDCDGNRRP